MKKTLLAVGGAVALCLCTVSANASPSIGLATALKTIAADGTGVAEQAHWRYHRHYRRHHYHHHYRHHRHYRRW
jgi:hypothetical protein